MSGKEPPLKKAQLDVMTSRLQLQAAIAQLNQNLQENLAQVTNTLKASELPLQLARRNPLLAAAASLIVGFFIGSQRNQSLDTLQYLDHESDESDESH